MKRNWVTKVGIILGIIGATYVAADGLSWIENHGKCHGQCGQNDRDCQQVCLDKGWLRYTRVREDAEDIVQQSFQKAFTHLGMLQGKFSFSTWVTRIAINEALMFLRRLGAGREWIPRIH